MEEKQITKITKRAIPGYTCTPCDGYYKLRKIGLTAGRVKKDPAFSRTRQQAREFGALVKLAKDIYAAIAAQTGIKKGVRRLISWLAKATKPGNGNQDINFQFNQQLSLAGTLHAEVACTYSKAGQMVSVTVPALVPAAQVVLPGGATRYRLQCTLLLVDDNRQVTVAGWQRSTLIPLKQIWVPAFNAGFSVSGVGAQLCCVVLAVQGYRAEEGVGPLQRINSAQAAAIVDCCWLTATAGMCIGCE
jgi:hypothetical protein